MNLLKQSTTYTRTFTMYGTDHVTAATGKTVTVNLSKAGAAFGAAGGTITEISNGWYKIALTTTDTNTLGDLSFRCTATACDDTNFVDQVYARTLDDLASPTNITAGTITTVTNLTNAPTAGDLTAAMKTSVTTAATAATPVAASVTGNVGGNVTGSVGSVVGAVGSVTGNVGGNVTGSVGSVVGAVGSVTGNVGGNVVGSVGSLTANNDKTGYTIASGGIGSGAIAAAEKNNIADACLDRRLDVGTDSSADTTTGRTWRSALRQLRNKVAIVAGVATTYKEDDSTTSHTSAITTTAGNPISTIDPT